MAKVKKYKNVKHNWLPDTKKPRSLQKPKTKFNNNKKPNIPRKNEGVYIHWFETFLEPKIIFKQKRGFSSYFL